MIHPWLGILLVLAILTGLMLALRLLQFWVAPHPELSRKLLHIGMGLVTLTFPWMFDEAWPVIVLAGLSVLVLGSLRLVRSLSESVGQVVSGVGRVSLGEVYFPIAVAILFLLYLHEDPSRPERRQVLYSVPTLLLALADAAAALVGVGYGRWRYATSDGEKSVEGSVAFFMMAFFCVHVPLLVFTNTGRSQTLLIAVLIAWLAMMFEAIAWRGLDNLVLPLVCFLLLRIYLDMDVAELRIRLGVTVSLMVFLLLYQQETTLLFSAVLGAFLVAYISWALGGWRWLLAPLVLFLSYTLLSPKTEANSQRIHNVHAVLSVSSAGFIWLFLSRILHREDFLFPYTLSFAAHLAIIGIARLKFDFPAISGASLLTICILKSWLLLFVPYFLAEGFTVGFSFSMVYAAAIGLAGVALAACAFYRLQPSIGNCPVNTPRWVRQAVHAGVASLLGFAVLNM